MIIKTKVQGGNLVIIIGYRDPMRKVCQDPDTSLSRLAHLTSGFGIPTALQASFTSSLKVAIYSSSNDEILAGTADNGGIRCIR